MTPSPTSTKASVANPPTAPDSTSIGTVAAYGTAVVLLGGAGVAAVFTDWDGLRGDDNE